MDSEFGLDLDSEQSQMGAQQVRGMPPGRTLNVRKPGAPELSLRVMKRAFQGVCQSSSEDADTDTALNKYNSTDE